MAQYEFGEAPPASAGFRPLLKQIEHQVDAHLQRMPVRQTRLERAATWVGLGGWAERRRARRETRVRALVFRFHALDEGRRADPS